MKLIDKEKVVAEIERLSAYLDSLHEQKIIEKILSIIDTIEVKKENPEPYFYCKYGGTMPLCSDCKRNHNNSSFKTEEITTWYAPSNGTKHCIDYIRQEQIEVDIKKIIEQTYHDGSVIDTADIDHVAYENVALYFYELGLKSQKGE